mmetsp:Transcript_3429/g.10131  ORF Transcript_3429/g.10131 Transcript_3429/m.10131 type:complete len:230 (-) Transcript_3429:575-1264(-)
MSVRVASSKARATATSARRRKRGAAAKARRASFSEGTASIKCCCRVTWRQSKKACLAAAAAVGLSSGSRQSSRSRRSRAQAEASGKSTFSSADGYFPVSILWRRMPKDHMSVRSAKGIATLPATASGAMYANVPATSDSRKPPLRFCLTARPKSVSFTRGASSQGRSAAEASSTFSIFRSRCTRPRACMCRTALKTWPSTPEPSSSSRGRPSVRRRSQRLPPRQSSRTR